MKASAKKKINLDPRVLLFAKNMVVAWEKQIPIFNEINK